MNGLTYIEVKKNRELYGDNSIKIHKKNSFIKQYLSSLSDPIIRILLIALGIKLVFLFKDFNIYETIGIVISILLASLISTISEYSSEKAFEKLDEDSSKIKCKVLRDSKIKETDIEDIVVNDIVLLQMGDRIPADGIIIEGMIYVDESCINGESKEKKKKINDIIYRGTVVYSHNAKMKVLKVGNNTFYGNIAKELQNNAPISPLKNRLIQLANIISKIGYIAAFLVFFSYLFNKIVISNNFNIPNIMNSLKNFSTLAGYILYGLTLCVTVIVVAVPEGLPMMITLVLSSNMKKMIKDNVLVRKLVGIETSGSLNVLYTDKTGTLTTGNLSVSNIVDGNYRKIDKTSTLYEYIKISFLYNNDSYKQGNNILGSNSVDKCLLKYINEEKKDIKIIEQIPFDSKYKYSKTVINYKNDLLNLKKGSIDVIVNECNYYYDNNFNKVKFNKEKYLYEIKRLYSNNQLLACSINNVFLVSIIIKDEIKSNTKEAIKTLKNAGINVVMVTGDNLVTAKKVAEEINLLDDKSIVLTSKELSKINDVKLKEIINNIKIVAEAMPNDKTRLVRISQEMDLVVGMTGDGVNDAPALKLADVGFAMGSGTEVAKEASDIVILDNNLLSISKAVLYGRTVYKSIRKFIIFQLTVNFCALSLSIIGPFINIESPITIVQMLWVNMVMDTLAGLAFSYEPALLEYMNELPKKKNDIIINKYMINEIIVTGLYSTIMSILFLKLPTFKNMFNNDEHFMTAFFGLFIFISVFNSFNARTHRLNIFGNLLSNKVFLFIILFVVIVQILLIYIGGEVFRTTGLTNLELLKMIVLSLTIIPFDFIRKTIYRIYNDKGGV